MILGLLAGCHAGRVADLEARIDALRGELRALDADATALQAQLDRAPPPTASPRVDHDPPGFDARRPLPAGDPQRPDVIVLSIDTLRADHLGAYGYERDTSPFLDELAAGGALFEDAWSASSWTLPSHTTMLSGLLPAHHGTIEDHLAIAPDVPLAQEAFRAAGYRTAGIVSTLFVSSRYGFDRGFDHFEDFGIRDRSANNLASVDADHVFHHALAWAQQERPGAPMFLFLHVYDAHYQYDPPPPWNERFDRRPRWGDEAYKNYGFYLQQPLPRPQLDHQIAQYDEEIAFVDAMFRELVEAWRASGRQAIVVVTADHGEEFGERGSWGHAHTLWPEQLHVPWIVAGPGVPAQRIGERVGSEDLAPTLLALAGLSGPAGDGVERASRICAGAPCLARVRPAPAPAGHVAAPLADTSRFDSLVYRWHEDPFDLLVDVGHGVRALCNLRADPGCRTNLYRERKDKAEALFSHLAAWLGEPWTARADGTVEVSEGALFQGGVRRSESLAVHAGDQFLAVPGDARVKFVAGARSEGPWRALGGTVPGAGCSLDFAGRWTDDNEIPELTGSETAMLVALGYQQAPEDDEAQTGPTPQGPAPCR